MCIRDRLLIDERLSLFNKDHLLTYFILSFTVHTYSYYSYLGLCTLFFKLFFACFGITLQIKIVGLSYNTWTDAGWAETMCVLRTTRRLYTAINHQLVALGSSATGVQRASNDEVKKGTLWE